MGDTVLCAECKAPFANKGAKWYLKLAQICKQNKRRNHSWSNVIRCIRGLIEIGEHPDTIMARIKALPCLNKEEDTTSATAAASVCDAAPAAAAASVCDAAPAAAAASVCDAAPLSGTLSTGM